MKTNEVISHLLAIFILANVCFATNFVPVDQADVLLITHSSLRTPNWIPDPEIDGAWETELLNQKAMQGYSVALLEIDDGTDQNYIRNYIVDNQGSFQFVLILGDARRPYPPEIDPPDPLELPQANFNTGNIVPIWREVVETIWWASLGGQYVAESDNGYIAGIPGVSIGRLPVQSEQQILDYVDKSNIYMADLDNVPPGQIHWSHYILEVLDDISQMYNLCTGSYVTAYTDACEKEFPSGWPVSTLATSTGPSSQSERASLFENCLNNTHYGLIHILGTSGDINHLVDWYNDNNGYDFTNYDYLPLMLALSCELGGFDQYVDNTELDCIVEEMLLLANGGIIGAVAPTGATLQRMSGIFAIHYWNTIFTESYVNFGEIFNRTLEKCNGAMSSRNAHLS